MKRPIRFEWLLALPMLLLLPFLAQFAYPLHSSYTDLAITHYPNAVFLRRAVLEFGQVPLWSNTILSGYPFAANPLAGLWYPPGWLALLMPLPLGLNLMAAMHVALGGVGMARLLQAEGLGQGAALLGGLVFELLPRISAHFAAGHLTLVYAFAWTPWLLAAARAPHGPARRFSGASESALLALILLADVRWAAYAVLLWAGYRLNQTGRLGLRVAVGWMRDVAARGVLALLVAAPLLLPLMEYTLRSTRQALAAAETLYLSLPPARLLGLLAPAFDGNTEWTVYAGASTLVLAVWALLQTDIRRPARFWMVVFLVSVLSALGAYLPGADLVSGLPGFNLLRVPARGMLPAGVGLAGLAAWTAQVLGGPAGTRLKQSFWARLGLAGLAGLAVLLAAGSWAVTRTPQAGFLWGAGFALLAVVLLFLRDRQMLSGQIWLGITGILVVADMVGVTAQMFVFRPATVVSAEGGQAAAYLAAKDKLFRVYSPSYSLPQQTSADFGLEMASGVDPLQLATYAGFMGQATGIPRKGYSVTLPPIAAGDPATANRGYVPDSARLGLLNVEYVLAEYDLPAIGLVEEARFGSTRVYRNTSALPRAWVVTDDPGVFVLPAPVEQISITPNRIAVDVRGPGKLVLAEIAYPGWQVWVDGHPARLDAHLDGLLRAVHLEAGQHSVVFRFVPASVLAGLGLCLAAAVWLLWPIHGGAHANAS